MVTAISSDLQRKNWLIQYDRKVPEGQTGPFPSYFRLLEWPFANDTGRTYECGMKVATSALSPDGSKVAFISGYHAGNLVHILDVRSGLVSKASSALSRAGLFRNVSWSVDGSMLITVDGSGFVAYRSRDLKVMRLLAAEYASGSLFMRSGFQVLLGTTSETRSYDVDDWIVD